MSSLPVEPVIEGHRPRPYRVAPTVTNAFAPWVTVLDDRLASAQFEWVLTDDALVPVTLVDDEASVRPKRSWRGRRRG